MSGLVKNPKPTPRRATEVEHDPHLVVIIEGVPNSPKYDGSPLAPEGQTPMYTANNLYLNGPLSRPLSLRSLNSLHHRFSHVVVVRGHRL